MELVNQNKNFVCKFCDKRYPCGKSLGGHIRIHFNGGGARNGASSTEEEEGEKIKVSKNTDINNSRLEAYGGQFGYVLRENPKKTSRFAADSSNIINSFLPEKVCKECGKGFPSLKALCGHMACHSKNSSFQEQQQSGINEKLKETETEAVMDDKSDSTESTDDPSKPQRRSKRMRYKTIGTHTCTDSLSSGSGIEQEQEEVAKCLMLLSKDSCFKGGFSSVADSSDNNSVVLEGKSSSMKMRISLNNGNKESMKMEKAAMQKEEVVIYVENDDQSSENSDSGYFRNGPKKVESEVSVHGFARNDEQLKKQNKLEIGSSFKDDDDEFDAESGQRLSTPTRCIRTQSGKEFIREDDVRDRAIRSWMDDSQKGRKNKLSSRPEFQSSKCVSLGGHRSSSHNNNNKHNANANANASSDSFYESGENSIDTDDYILTPIPKRTQSRTGKTPIEQQQQQQQNSSGKAADKKLGLMKKGKTIFTHECPFCPKVFKSGQALGGHKRSHFIGAAGDRHLVIKPDVLPTEKSKSIRGLIDLNVPVSMEDDESDGW